MPVHLAIDALHYAGFLADYVETEAELNKPEAK